MATLNGDDAVVVEKDMTEAAFQRVRNVIGAIINETGLLPREWEMGESLNNDSELGGSGRWYCVRSVDKDVEIFMSICDEGMFARFLLGENPENVFIIYRVTIPEDITRCFIM